MLNKILINLLTTWLGSILTPGTPFYLTAQNDKPLNEVIDRVAKIGYKVFIEAAFVFGDGILKNDLLDLSDFKNSPHNYQIVDIRNYGERKEQPGFAGSLHIPLPGLMERTAEIPTGKPIVVHCAGGYRSAAGSSSKIYHPKTPPFTI